MSLLQLSGIHKSIAGRTILHPAGFTLQQGRNIAIAGETGAGKSTLLQIIAGLEQTDGGTVLFEGKKVKGPMEQMMSGHPGIAYLSQHYELRHRYRVEELLDMANSMPDEEAARIYEVCRITHLLKRKTDQLSGGEKQRAALARLLITRPRLLLLDEPFSNMDLIHKGILKAVLSAISHRLQITCILSSHDPADYLSWAQEVFIMQDGHILQRGTPAQVYYKPCSEYAGGITGGYNLLPPGVLALFPGYSPGTHTGAAFIRPEQLTLAAGNDRGAVATVTQVSFLGSFYEILAQLGSTVVSIRVMHTHAAPGDQVYVSLPATELWYIH